MVSIELAISACLQDDWHLSNLIYLDPDWQVNISNGEHVVVATGETIQDALLAAQAKTLDESKYAGRLFSLGRLRLNEPTGPSSLLAALGLGRKTQPVKRRI